MNAAVAPVTACAARPGMTSSHLKFARGSRVRSGCRVRRGRGGVGPFLTTRAVAIPPRDASKQKPEVSSAVSKQLLGPLDAASLACETRTAEVPYFDNEVDRQVLVNDAARAAIEESKATQFISLPSEKDEALVILREIMEKGWKQNEAMGSGSAKHWPELFEAGADLVKQTLGAQWPADSIDVFPGTGWLEEEDGLQEVAVDEVLQKGSKKGSQKGSMKKSSNNNSTSNAIDWVMRRPEGHVVSSKVHFATRLHRDPDSWTNPTTPHRPKDGWTDLSMKNRGRYAYRFVNVWLARSAIDPTGQVWQSPLVVCLPRDGGNREWAFQKRKLAMEENEAQKEYNVQGINPMDPKTWIPGANRLFRPLWNPAGADENKSEASAAQLTDAETSEMSSFEFPELTPSDDHVFVAAPVLVFDSFDLWHGAAKWTDSDDCKKLLRTIDTKGRQPFHRARCSVEMRFRIRIDVEKANEQKNNCLVSPWGPFSSAVASGKFRDDGLRDSEARYDLEKGQAVK